MKRRSLYIAVFGVLFVWASATPVFGQYGAAASLNKAAYAPGETGTATLTSGLPSTQYQADFAQSPGVIIGRGTTNAAGGGTVNFTIPTNARVGSATLTFDPDGGTAANNIVKSLSIVAATSTATTSPTPGTVALPVTGGRIGQFSTIALALMALGTVLILSVRRRTAPALRSGPITLSPERFKEALRGLGATRFGNGS